MFAHFDTGVLRLGVFGDVGECFGAYEVEGRLRCWAERAGRDDDIERVLLTGMGERGSPPSSRVR